VSSDPTPLNPDLIVELNQATNDVLAKLRTQAVVDRGTVVRLSQQIVAYHSDGAYVQKMWETVRALADVVEREGELELAARLRSIAARR